MKAKLLLLLIPALMLGACNTVKDKDSSSSSSSSSEEVLDDHDQTTSISDERKGEEITMAEAKVIIGNIISHINAMTADDISKMSTNLRIFMDDDFSKSQTNYSKEEPYLHNYSDIKTKVEFEEGKYYPNRITSDLHFYPDAGQYLTAQSYFFDGYEMDEDGQYHFHNNESYKYYTYMETGVSLRDSIDVYVESVITMMQSYATQMSGMIDSYVDIPESYQRQLGIKVYSAGEGSLYFLMDAVTMGSKAEFLIENNMLTYAYSYSNLAIVKAMSGGELEELEYDIMSAELIIKPGVCDKTYPDLSSYQYVGANS